ncbi:hypothetical protein AB1N83_011323 [Pleurotus pulmonarius]
MKRSANMFANILIFAFFASLAVALQIEPLENAHTQGDVRITWIGEADDASRFAAFSVFLHHPSFSSDFAILNNQCLADGGADVMSRSPPFLLKVATPSARQTSPLPCFTSSTSSSLAFPSGFAPGTASGSATILSVSSTSAFGMTVSSPAASSRLGTSGGTGSGTNTAAQQGATNSNANGAAGVGVGSWVLGAAVVGLGWVAERY